MVMAELERLADLKAKQVERLVEGPKPFAVLSAWKGDRTRSENKAAMARLRQTLAEQGYRPIDAGATWKDTETGQLYGETSLIVPGISADEAFKLGREFEQDSVIYKSPKGVLGMYDTKSNDPKAYLAHGADGSPAYQIQTEKSRKKEKGKGPRRKEREREELFSRTRGVNFEFDFLWDHPVSFGGDDLVSPKRMQEVVRDAFPTASSGVQADWKAFLAARWDDGHKLVRNTNPKSRDAYPRVTMLTLMKTDPKFRANVRQRFRKFREERNTV
jgi:hypothetical protein